MEITQASFRQNVKALFNRKIVREIFTIKQFGNLKKTTVSTIFIIHNGAATAKAITKEPKWINFLHIIHLLSQHHL